MTAVHPDPIAMSSVAPTSSLFPGFESHDIKTDDNVTIHAVCGGAGPALLLLHGHPQSHAIWHRVAPLLAQRYRVIAADLRGYGDSSKPAGDSDHGNYSKRVMARDMLRLMKVLGHQRFAIIGHDRGARVAHRLALDHAAHVRRLVMLDIAPTLAMYEQTTEAFARAYWHWFFLIQPSPLPERLIEANPKAYVHEMMGRRVAGLTPFDPRALAEYARCLAQPGAAHSLCEDYRASASIDLEHDRASIEHGQMLEVPALVLWGQQGVVHRCFKPLDEWRKVARQIEGAPLACGHYIPEEAPEALLARALPFLEAGAA
jgi:haloacetate dehalogenase